jgi:hypothetical protein
VASELGRSSACRFRMGAELTCVAGVGGKGSHASMMALVLWDTPPGTTPDR